MGRGCRQLRWTNQLYDMAVKRVPNEMIGLCFQNRYTRNAILNGNDITDRVA